MYFLKTGNGYVTTIEFVNKEVVWVKLDTGSYATVLPLKTLCKVLGTSDMEGVREELVSYKSTQCISYTGHTSTLVPVYVRNVNIDGLILDKFYFYVNVDPESNTPLIGMDFIAACRFDRSEGNYGVDLSDIDEASYESNFKKGWSDWDIHEIFELKKNLASNGLKSLFGRAEGK